MTFFCTQCWKEVSADARICPHCGDDMVARQAQADFVDKLIAALWHPEPTTPIRAAWILGQRRERRAVPALIKLAGCASDPFIIAAAVAALRQIGDKRAESVLIAARRHRSLHVRRAAAEG